MISSLGKQGGRRSQMGNTSSIIVGRLLSLGETVVVIPPVVTVGGGIGHGGDRKKRKNKKPVLIKVEEYESPAEVIRQIEEKYSNSVKKSASKPKVKVETPLVAPSRSPEQWVSYYKAMADNLATQRDYRQMLDLIARASLSIKQAAERQEVERQEEELITLLLVSL